MAEMAGSAHADTPRSRARVLAAAGVVAVAAGTGVGLWMAFRSSPNSAPATSYAAADRGTIAVTVSGSGPVTAVGWAGGVSGSGAKASAGSVPTAGGTQVYPRASGQVLRSLVHPGQVVGSGQPLALLGDPTAVDAVVQARIGLDSALAQSGADPAAVALAQAKLTALTAPGRPALTQARLDLANAAAAYATLRRGTQTSTAARAAGALAVKLAEQKLGAAYQPPYQTTVLAAQLGLSQAQAKLNALHAAAASPLASELQAANLALTLAKQKLAALTNPTAADRTAAELEVAKAQAALDALHAAPPATDPAAIRAAQQEVALASQTLADLTAPLPTQAQVAAAQRALHDANQKLAVARSGPGGAAAVAAAQQAVTAATQHLSGLVGSPRLANLTQAQLDLRNARAAQRTLLRGSAGATRTALNAGALAVRLARERLAQFRGHPDAAALAQARADLVGASANARTDALRVAAARDTLRIAQLHRRSLVVRSPARGTVTNVLVAPGAQVDPTVAVAAIADLGHLSVTINMSEFDVANVKVGDRAVVNVAALGGSAITGRVSAVAPVGVNNSGVVQFPVTVALKTTPTNLRPGMLAGVQVTTSERHGVVRVPLDAVGTIVGGQNDGQTYVTVVDRAGRKQRRLVDLGLAGPTRVEVLRGVKPGDRLLIQVVSAASGGAANPGAPASNAPPGIGVQPGTPDNGGGNQQGQ